MHREIHSLMVCCFLFHSRLAGGGWVEDGTGRRHGGGGLHELLGNQPIKSTSTLALEARKEKGSMLSGKCLDG